MLAFVIANFLVAFAVVGYLVIASRRSLQRRLLCRFVLLTSAQSTHLFSDTHIIARRSTWSSATAAEEELKRNKKRIRHW